MKRKGIMVAGLVLALIVLVATAVNAAGQAELANVRKATVKFRQIEAAQTAGYDLVEGLDHCFDKPGVGGMGFHYINEASLDLKLNPLRPEAMVYAPGRNGQLKLGAIEYIVPAAEWEEAGNDEPPSVLGHHLHLNQDLGVYVLHVWLWRHNPKGMFEDWNPNVSCPEQEDK